jgi:hypothetical protein
MITAVPGQDPEGIRTSWKVPEEIPLVATIQSKPGPALPDGKDIIAPVKMVITVKEFPERIIGSCFGGIEILIPGKLQHRQVIFTYPLKVFSFIEVIVKLLQVIQPAVPEQMN